MSDLGTEKTYRIFECGGCDQYHPLGWAGDCRDDEHRYDDPEDYAERNGVPLRLVKVVGEGDSLDFENGERIVGAPGV